MSDRPMNCLRRYCVPVTAVGVKAIADQAESSKEKSFQLAEKELVIFHAAFLAMA